MLKLRIENSARLSDGGPLTYQADRRGFDLGRDHHLDWTLPDPSRQISGKHCEIRFFDSAYWLYDVSTNGTFVNRSTRRVQSPYKLCDGDELAIGDYLISVSVTGESASLPRGPVQDPPERRVPEPENIWHGTGVAPSPISPKDLMPPVRRGSRAADFLSSAANIPSASLRQGAEISAASDPWVTPGAGSVSLAAESVDGWKNASEMPSPVGSADARQPDKVVPQPPRRPPANEDALARSEREFIRNFAAGANIPEDVLLQRGGELAQELGVLMRIVCTNLMELLSARAAAKTLARSGHRTLIKPIENNPLKFMPSAEEALRVMLGPRSESYLDGRQTIEQAFSDLKAHQMGTLAAMQLAIAQLLEELSPEAIEKSVAGAKKPLLGTNKAKLWEIFLERWNAKSAHHEHGMLGEFLGLFADFYDKESRGRR